MSDYDLRKMTKNFVFNLNNPDYRKSKYKDDVKALMSENIKLDDQEIENHVQDQIDVEECVCSAIQNLKVIDVAQNPLMDVVNACRDKGYTIDQIEVAISKILLFGAEMYRSEKL